MISKKCISEIFSINENSIQVLSNSDYEKFIFSWDGKSVTGDIFVSFFEKVAERDSLNIKITSSDQLNSEYNECKKTTVSEIDNVINEYINLLLSEDDMIGVEFKIKKQIENGVFSVYDFEKFSEFLFCSTLTTCMSRVGSFISRECRKFENLNSSEVVVTDSIIIAQDFSAYSNGKAIFRRDTVLKRNKTCRVVGIETELVPDDFNIIVCSVDSIKEHFDKIKLSLSLVYISDQSHIDSHAIDISINGHRLFEKTITLPSMKNVNPVFYDIYRWLYQDGNISDKMYLVRNAISLSCKINDILDIEPSVLATIKSNYNLYLQDNVKDFIGMKKDIVNTMQNFCNNMGEAINKFSGHLKGNFIAVVGYVCAALLTDKAFKFDENSFAEPTWIILLCLIIGSFIYLVISLVEATHEKRLCDTYIASLKEFYSDVLEESVIEQVVTKNQILMVSNKNFRNRCILITIVWILFIAIAIILLCVFKPVIVPSK